MSTSHQHNGNNLKIIPVEKVIDETVLIGMSRVIILVIIECGQI